MPNNLSLSCSKGWIRKNTSFLYFCIYFLYIYHYHLLRKLSSKQINVQIFLKFQDITFEAVVFYSGKPFFSILFSSKMLTFSLTSQEDQNTSKRGHERSALLKYLYIWDVCKLPKGEIMSFKMNKQFLFKHVSATQVWFSCVVT